MSAAASESTLEGFQRVHVVISKVIMYIMLAWSEEAAEAYRTHFTPCALSSRPRRLPR